MISDFLISLILIPWLHNASFNFDGYLGLNGLQPGQNQVGPQRIYTDYLDIRITAKSAMAVDAVSGKILYQKNPEAVLPIASITKLMTALVFLDHNPGWQNEITMLPSDHRNGGVNYLKDGDSLTLENLFKTALIVSDNDAAVALARSTGLSAEDFVAEMNAKAATLGLHNAHFADPTGLLDANQATVSDLIILLNAALKNQEIIEATSTSHYEFNTLNDGGKRQVRLNNTNSLLNSYLNILGGKTGSLEAGDNLAVKIKGDKNQQIIAVVLGSQSNNDRFQDVKAIADWVFNNYKWQ